MSAVTTAHPGRGAATPGAPRTLHADRLRALQRRYVWLVVVTPFAGLLAAIVSLWGSGIGPIPLAVLGVMYALTILGIGVGFHRHFTHRAFECRPAVRWLLAMFGSMAVEGPLIYWVATHRLHHQESDLAHDPHSPRTTGRGVIAALRGLWHAHVGWMFSSPPANALRYAPDLLSDPVSLRANRLYVVFVCAGLLVPAALAGVVTGSRVVFWQTLLWGGLVRVFLVQHVTWSVNSICHRYGQRPYETGDDSCNNQWLALPSFGESWHNNHHAFPSSAWHGIERHEWDISGLVVQTLASAGLAWHVVLPPPTIVERKRVVTRVGPARP